MNYVGGMVVRELCFEAWVCGVEAGGQLGGVDELAFGDVVWWVGFVLWFVLSRGLGPGVVLGVVLLFGFCEFENWWGEARLWPGGCFAGRHVQGLAAVWGVGGWEGWGVWRARLAGYDLELEGVVLDARQAEVSVAVFSSALALWCCGDVGAACGRWVTVGRLSDIDLVCSGRLDGRRVLRGRCSVSTLLGGHCFRRV